MGLRAGLDPVVEKKISLAPYQISNHDSSAV
jgi:hypothetical protein